MRMLAVIQIDELPWYFLVIPDLFQMDSHLTDPRFEALTSMSLT
jgi:hypothetical protein